MEQHLFKAGVFALIFDDQGHILLCHRRDNDIWNFPGGRIEAGEAPWEAVVRETKEEVCLDIEVDYLLGVYYKPDANEISFAFICNVLSGKECLTDEADQIEYFNVQKLPKNISPKQVERIKDAVNKKDSKTLFKIQRGPKTIFPTS